MSRKNKILVKSISDLKVGDQLVFRRDLGKVTGVASRSFTVQYGDSAPVTYSETLLRIKGSTLTRAARPLPTAVGSIVKVGPISNPAVWMRVWNSDSGYGWISEARVFMKDDEFEAFLQRNPRRNFEIILDRSKW